MAGLTWWRRSLLLAGALILAWPGAGEARILRVVSDDNYPPYLYRLPDGRVEGYLVDLWALWEQATGVPVRLTATHWAAAQQAIGRGDADVIDMIFRTPAREALYEFSPPYAELPVAIYRHVSYGGITSLTSLQGRAIGVQEGDACVDQLVAGGVTRLRSYLDYTDLIQAAVEGKVQLFCADEYPAAHYLKSLQADRLFTKAFALEPGQFHRAVRRGDGATLRLVEQGMAAIDPAAKADLARKWLLPPGPGWPAYLLYGGSGLVLLLVLGGALTWRLRRRHRP